jgi:inorganic pyrophosphatase
MLKEFVIGATVEGHVDRPLGTAHPDYPTMVYPINYGYVDGIMAEDDEEQDVYILGSDKPLTTYKGDFRCDISFDSIELISSF